MWKRVAAVCDIGQAVIKLIASVVVPDLFCLELEFDLFQVVGYPEPGSGQRLNLFYRPIGSDLFKEETFRCYFNYGQVGDD